MTVTSLVDKLSPGSEVDLLPSLSVKSYDNEQLGGRRDYDRYG